jgi:hypothetical protein
MTFFTKLIGLATILFFAGCTNIDCDVNKDKVVHPLPGTNTVVIGIGLDKDGVPYLAAKEIILNPGQKVLFAGPDEFTVIFKNKKSPNRKIDNNSVNGVVVISVPSGILEQSEFVEEFRKNGELKFSYGVRVNGKELDPDIIVRRR